MDDRVGNRGETAVSTIDIDRDIIDLVYIYIYISLFNRAKKEGIALSRRFESNANGRRWQRCVGQTRREDQRVTEEEKDGEGEGTLQGLRGLQAREQWQHVVVEEVYGDCGGNVGPFENASVEASEVPLLRRRAGQGEPPLVSQRLRNKPRYMRPPRGLYLAGQLHLPRHRGRDG